VEIYDSCEKIEILCNSSSSSFFSLILSFRGIILFSFLSVRCGAQHLLLPSLSIGRCKRGDPVISGFFKYLFVAYKSSGLYASSRWGNAAGDGDRVFHYEFHVYFRFCLHHHLLLSLLVLRLRLLFRSSLQSAWAKWKEKSSGNDKDVKQLVMWILFSYNCWLMTGIIHEMRYIRFASWGSSSVINLILGKMHHQLLLGWNGRKWSTHSMPESVAQMSETHIAVVRSDVRGNVSSLPSYTECVKFQVWRTLSVIGLLEGMKYTLWFLEVLDNWWSNTNGWIN